MVSCGGLPGRATKTGCACNAEHVNTATCPVRSATRIGPIVFPVPIAEWDKHWPDKVAKLGAMMRETGRYGA